LEVVQSILNGNVDARRDDIEQLTGMTRDLYHEKPNVMEIPSRNVFFIGDLHGELESISIVQKLFSKYKTHSFVFLGDYADRGPAQIETINLVMALAVSDPDRVLLLRGNHESDEIAQQYGFYTEVTRKFSFDVYSKYLEVFQVLPMAAISSEAIFTCHGGIPEGVTSVDEIQKCNRFNMNFPDDILHQLAWNDPKDADFRFAANSRGRRVRAFGRIAFDEFLENLGLKIMVRAHEVFAEGVKTFFDGRLTSVFSASYRGAVTPKVVRVGSDLKIEIIPLIKSK
jgi:predicted phosphodiesterase